MNPSLRAMRRWHADRMERDEDSSSVPVMSASAITAACLRHDGYESPELNETLYLHFKGFMRIQNLEPYTGLRALFLESNNLRRIEGVGHLTGLRALFLQQNAIARIEGLDGLAALNTLNLSQNAIERIEPGSLACLPALATLVLSRNRLQSADDVAAVAECGSLTNLDLSHNDIDDSAVVDAVRALPALACLALTGNPFLRTARQYRKTVLAALPRLAHLDDRPVFEEERVAVTAWEVGGAKAERDARKEYKEEMQRRDRSQMEAYRGWVERKREDRAAALAAVNEERSARGEPPLRSLPPRVRVRYQAAVAEGREDAAAVAADAAASGPAEAASAAALETKEVLAGGVVRVRDDRRIGVVPGAAEGISAEASAMADRIEAEGAAWRGGEREEEAGAAATAPGAGATGDGTAEPGPRAAEAEPEGVAEPEGEAEPATAAAGAPVPADEAEAPASTAGVSGPLPASPPAAPDAPQPDVTMSEEQNAVYQSLRMFARRRGDDIPDSTVGGGAGSVRSDAGWDAGARSAAAGDGASLGSETTMGTSASMGASEASGPAGVAGGEAGDASSVAATVGGGSRPPRGAGAADPSLWSDKLDAALRRLVPAAKFDWRRAAAAMQKAVRSGRLPPPPGPAAAGVSVTRAASVLTPDAVRQRFAELSAPAPAPSGAAGPGPGPGPSSMRRRVAAAGITTADTGVAAGVALASAAARGKAAGPRGSLLPAPDGPAIPLGRLLKGPRFELAAYSDHVRPASLPSVGDFGDDEDDDGEDGDGTSVWSRPGAAAAASSSAHAEGKAPSSPLAPLTRADIEASLAGAAAPVGSAPAARAGAAAAPAERASPASVTPAEAAGAGVPAATAAEPGAAAGEAPSAAAVASSRWAGGDDWEAEPGVDGMD